MTIKTTLYLKPLQLIINEQTIALPYTSICALEGGVAAVATSSGMAAQFTGLFLLLSTLNSLYSLYSSTH